MDALSNSSTIRADTIEICDSDSSTYKGIQQLVLGIPPASMNTLEKLAAAIGNDPEYFETVAAGLDSKADLALTTSELAGKEPLVTLAVNRVVTTTNSGQLEASNVSNTELASLSGVSSSVQSQLDSKEPTYTAISPLVEGFSLASSGFEIKTDEASDLVANAFQS